MENYDLSPDDLDIMARTMIGEDPTMAGQAGVASVMLNRLHSGDYPSSIPGIAYQPNAFESWGSRAPALEAISQASPEYQQAYRIAQAVASGAIGDPTGGATNFLNPRLQTSLGRSIPAWAQGTPTAVIGQQSYFAPEDKVENVPDLLGSWGSAPNQSVPSSSNAATPDLLGSWSSGPSSSVPSNSASGGAPSSMMVGDRAVSPAELGMIGGQYESGTAGSQAGFDRTAPVAQQLGFAANQGANYLGNQVSGIPAAGLAAYQQGNALRQSGGQDLANSNFLPSFPSSNPATWGGGGLLKYGSGALGQVFSPITGAVQQLVQDPVTQMTGSPEIGSRAGFVANSLAAPLAMRGIGNLGNALGNTAIGTVDPETAQLAALARNKYNIPVNAPQMSGGLVNVASSALNKLPFSGANADLAEQQLAMNRAVLNTIGENSTKLTPSAMSAAKNRLGQVYDIIGARTTINADPQFQNDILGTMSAAEKELSEAEMKPLMASFENIINKIDSNSTISGDAYHALVATGSPLDRAIDSQSSSVGYFARQMKGHLDAAFQRSATPEDQAALAQANRQYANLKTIEPIVAKASTGDISPALLMGRVNAQTHNGLAYGYGGDLGDLARIGNKFLREPGTSNTSERALTYGALGSLGTLLGANETGLLHLPAVSPLEMGAVPGALLANRLVSGGLRSNALANALINRSLRARSSNALSVPLGVAAGAATLNPSVNALAAPNQ